MKKHLFNTPYIILGLIILCHLFLLSRMIFFPYPELFVYPYLTNQGLIPYKQIFDQHFPGLMFFPINFNTLGMTTWQAARLWQYSIVVIIQIELFFVARKIFKSDKLALLSNIFFLILQPFFEGWVLWIDSFLPVFLLPAFIFSLEAKDEGGLKNYFLAGLFFGLSIIMKQVVIPLAGLSFIYLLIRGKGKNLHSLLWFFIGIIPFPLIALLYFYSKGAIVDFWYWTVTYNLTTFAQYGRKFPSAGEIFKVTIILGFSLLSIFEKKLRGIIIWILLFIVGASFAAYARFDFIHFQPALPFICMALSLSLIWISSKKRFRILAVMLYVVSFFYLMSFFRGHLGNEVLFFDKDTISVADKLSEETKPGQHIFLYGVSAHIYQISRTLPAGDVFVFQFPWFMRVREGKILDGIIRDKPEIILADRSIEISGQKIGDFEPNITQYILDNYRIKDKIGSVEFLVRK